MKVFKALFILVLLLGFSFEALALLDCENQTVSSSFMDDGEPSEGHEGEEQESSDSDIDDKVKSSVSSIDSDLKNNHNNLLYSQNKFSIFLERWQRPPRFI